LTVDPIGPRFYPQYTGALRCTEMSQSLGLARKGNALLNWVDERQCCWPVITSTSSSWLRARGDVTYCHPAFIASF